VCLIAYRPVKPGKRGSNIPVRVVDTALTRHPDGFGVAWREGRHLRVERFAPAERKDFAKKLRMIDRDQRIEYVAHFRYATHGAKDAQHAHPYEYIDPQEGRVLVFHNGIIDIPTASDESDTQVFVRDVLARLAPAWWREPALRYLVGEAISWSRLILMTETETVNLQESAGQWDGGLWYSSNHKPAATVWGSWEWDGKTFRRHADPNKTVADDIAARAIANAYDRASDANTSAPVSKLRHAGHSVSALVEIRRDVDREYEQAVVCDTCYTVGDVYVIDGQVYMDLAHLVGPAARDADEEEWPDGERMRPISSAVIVSERGVVV